MRKREKENHGIVFGPNGQGHVYKPAPYHSYKAAKRKEKITAEVQLHSDQGFQYTSQAYFNLTQSYGITPSMSRRGNPYDNALSLIHI